MTKKQVYKQLREISNNHTVTLRIYHNSNSALGGKSNPRHAQIQLNMKPYYSIDIILSVFYHELGHILDYRTKILKEYYAHDFNKDLIKKYAVRAEMHADYTGRELMKVDFPNNTYLLSHSKKDRKLILEFYGIKE